ncbi:MAG: YbaB/EbfC family nucleoid-associated protein [Bacilli bacterium]|nr:YbaB/EbfC family nucleoid-associated protein [Bacilli bacterium]MBQ8901716.1 YbaB/EbfC family nucleoid-associated protein [Bacilli bacterium]
MNMQNLMAQAQRMQREITAKKEELEKMEFVGKSEWIEMTFNGARQILNVKIIKDGDIEDEDKEILEDMIQIATKDAFIQINNAMNDKLGQYAGALDGLM